MRFMVKLSKKRKKRIREMRKTDILIQSLILGVLVAYVFFPQFVPISDREIAIIWIALAFLDAITIGHLHDRIEKLKFSIRNREL